MNEEYNEYGFSARLGICERDQIGAFQNAALHGHYGDKQEKVVSVDVLPNIPKEVVDQGDQAIAEYLHRLFAPLLAEDKITMTCEIGNPGDE